MAPSTDTESVTSSDGNPANGQDAGLARPGRNDHVELSVAKPLQDDEYWATQAPAGLNNVPLLTPLGATGGISAEEDWRCQSDSADGAKRWRRNNNGEERKKEREGRESRVEAGYWPAPKNEAPEG